MSVTPKLGRTLGGPKVTPLLTPSFSNLVHRVQCVAITCLVYKCGSEASRSQGKD